MENSHPQNTPVEIYRLQIPMFSVSKGRAVCFNRTRNHRVSVPIEKSLLDLMNNRTKIFVYAQMKDGQFNIIEEATKQEW